MKGFSLELWQDTENTYYLCNLPSRTTFLSAPSTLVTAKLHKHWKQLEESSREEQPGAETSAETSEVTQGWSSCLLSVEITVNTLGIQLGPQRNTPKNEAST